MSAAGLVPVDDISIHALREEGDSRSRLWSTPLFISIHALREEGDICRRTSPASASLFLSTPSARRATPSASYIPTMLSYFYPRPPRGGRRSLKLHVAALEDISIHALREEGDLSVLQALEWMEIFLSTPSARRATRRLRRSRSLYLISIHALREEGDDYMFDLLFAPLKFLSTPSARRATAHRRRGRVR